jgi:Co/Zn/Cd efflux system component/predicted transcriptional regulator
MSRKRRRHGDFFKFILLALLKKGSLSLEDLKQLASILEAQFDIVGQQFGATIFSRFFSNIVRPAAVRSSKMRKANDLEVNVELECKDLQTKGLIELNDAHRYQLTIKGEDEAKQFSKALEKGNNFFENQLLGPVAAARNTVVIDFFLAIMKLLFGFLGGSVGLISDGADASIDTLSASVSWIGMKLKRESIGVLITILMMFVAGITVGYESVSKINDAIHYRISPLTLPYLVIGAETVALVFAVFLFFYQRFTGKRNGSLALISQSVDSKNHIYVATMVIVGAIFSIFGISLVDALVGAFVAARIIIDASGLSRDMLSSMKGEEINLSKYEVPLEKEWQLSKLQTFRIWTLFSIVEEKAKTKEEIISSLERTFKPQYVPILSEFGFSLGKGYDFNGSFDMLMKPLLNERLLIQDKGEFVVTDQGRNLVNRMVKNIRYRQVYP